MRFGPRWSLNQRLIEQRAQLQRQLEAILAKAKAAAAKDHSPYRDAEADWQDRALYNLSIAKAFATEAGTRLATGTLHLAEDLKHGVADLFGLLGKNLKIAGLASEAAITGNTAARQKAEAELKAEGEQLAEALAKAEQQIQQAKAT